MLVQYYLNNKNKRMNYSWWNTPGKRMTSKWIICVDFLILGCMKLVS